MKIHVIAATSREDGYFCLLLYQALCNTLVPCGQLVHRYNTGQESYCFPMTDSGTVDGPASAAAAGIVVAASGSPMTTASKASCWAHCCAMATGICQVEEPRLS